jgi:hypothetical protein
MNYKVKEFLFSLKEFLMTAKNNFIHHLIVALKKVFFHHHLDVNAQNAYNPKWFTSNNS